LTKNPENKKEEQKDTFFCKTVTKRKIRFRVKIIILIIFILVLYYFRSFILYEAGDYLVVKDDEVKDTADVMFIEDGYNANEIFNLCFDLYKQGKCKRVLFIKTDNDTYIFNDLYLEEFLKSKLDSSYKDFPYKIYNLPVEHPVTLNRSKEILDTLKKFNIKSVLLLTSGFHSRRSKKVYEGILKDSGIKLYVNTYFIKVDRNDWWTKADGFREVVSEYLKYIYYVIRGYI
jgi:hypothetical protein